MKEFISVSPLRILEKSSRKKLGPGNLGVLISPAGGGKTTCLIHFALDKILREEKLVHISLEERPKKVMAYYNVIYSDIVKALKITDDHDYRVRIDRERMILAYLNQSFKLERLRANLSNLTNELRFKPNALIVDGLDFENCERAIFEALEEVAIEFDVEIWFSALSHRHINKVNERGIPYPCHKIDDIFSLIMQLQTEPSGVLLRLLKDHDNPALPNISVRLDPSTFLTLD